MSAHWLGSMYTGVYFSIVYNIKNRNSVSAQMNYACPYYENYNFKEG